MASREQQQAGAAERLVEVVWTRLLVLMCALAPNLGFGANTCPVANTWCSGLHTRRPFGRPGGVRG